MDSNINISVIIPAYNAKDTIIPCLESVLNQTYKILEILVINDGSIDNTESVINDFVSSRGISNLFLFSQLNSGPSKARNYGIEKSKGNWIAFIDSDDKWLPQKIERQVQHLISNPTVKLIGTNFISKRSNFSLSNFQIITFKMMLFKDRIFTSTVLVEKKILTTFYFNEAQKYSEDYRLWLLITNVCKSIVLNEGLAIYAENKELHKSYSLSSKLFEMEIGELSNFLFLYKTNKINLFYLSLATLNSILKFFKRLLINKLFI